MTQPPETIQLVGTMMRDRDKYVPKAHNELVCPQQPKEVVDEGILHMLVPLEVIAAVGVIGTLLQLSSSAALYCRQKMLMPTSAGWGQACDCSMCQDCSGSWVHEHACPAHQQCCAVLHAHESNVQQ